MTEYDGVLKVPAYMLDGFIKAYNDPGCRKSPTLKEMMRIVTEGVVTYE